LASLREKKSNILKNMRNKYNTIKLLPYLLVVLSACGNDIETVNQFIKKDEVSKERATNVEMLYSDSAVVRVRVKAPEMLHISDPEKPRQTFPKGIDVDFFDKNKVQSSRLLSRYAERDENNGLVHLRDSVRIWNDKQERMDTEELFWDEGRQRIYSDKFVKITTPNEVIHGRGFESTSDFSHWTLKEVTGTVQSKTLFQEGF
jgi:LPS export ABC transporter protein LptC